MKNVSITGNTAAWPKLCVCCEGPSAVSVKISKEVKYKSGNKQITETLTWEVPHCKACADHTQVWLDANELTGFEWLNVVLTLGLGYPIMLWRKRFFAKGKAKKLLTPACKGNHEGAISFSWHGETKAFHFQSDAVATAFEQANADRLAPKG
jgi:hypothetical protein